MKKYIKQLKRIEEMEKRLEEMERLAKDWNSAISTFHIDNQTEIPVHDCNRR